MKKLIKISLVLAVQIVFLAGVVSTALATCDSSCTFSVVDCSNPSCDTCSACLPATSGGGIFNPVINPSVGGVGQAGVGAVIIARLIAEFLSIAFIVAGLVLLAMILFAGIEWMTAAGDQNKLKSAQGRLTNALVGFTIVVALRAILGFIAEPLGVPWLDTLKIIWPTP